ncbi:polar amino acid transport system substrate-binding protein [Psychromicrobium silvestre]|uniref:Polar amino acid transport system substrate-binding protein n=1 Tax=Psychromicrobium silvestre TaxID=1645614 RepID=A0A7Y9S412_9MICC|nr:ABC transporter substrate-binding protein [Psychromicrobium silvestre]NYE94173.1 polar amino acid transport system substrate-binding protein [Psychromicrobium silvestre]
MKNKAVAVFAVLGLALLGPALAGCADPGSTGGAQDLAPTAVSEASSAEPIRAKPNPEAAALLPAAIKERGTLVVGNSPGSAPLSFYASDNTTIVGSDPAFAQLVADALGLKLELQATSWADWPLGVSSGKYDLVISNVTVTEERKERFDFSTYRNDTLGFYAKSDSKIGEIKEPADIAGKKVIVGSGTNQEKILLAWDAQNKAKGLAPVELQYYDDVSASDLALQSGRADLTFGPNATGAYKAAINGKTKLLGLVPGGWPLTAEIAATSKKGAGLADAVTAAFNGLIKSGEYQKVLDRWGLSSEAVTSSRTNPPGLPKS